MVSETQKGPDVKKAGEWRAFAQLRKELEKWLQTHLNERRPKSGVSVELTDDHRKERTGIDRVGNLIKNQWLEILTSVFNDEGLLRVLD